MDAVRLEHSMAINDIVLWSDSKTVLRWIGSTHRRYKQFVVEGISMEVGANSRQRSG